MTKPKSSPRKGKVERSIRYSVELSIEGKWIVVAWLPLNTNLVSVHCTKKLAERKLRMIERRTPR